MLKASKALIQEYPDSFPFHLNYIYSLTEADSIERAFPRYQEMASTPDRLKRSEANLFLGLLYNQKKDFLHAKLSFNRVRHRNLPGLHLGMGVAEAGLKRYEKAETAMLHELSLRGETAPEPFVNFLPCMHARKWIPVCGSFGSNTAI
ncbi:MAG: hypothetical protein R3B47_12745 [Bacteroidia bacterium]